MTLFISAITAILIGLSISANPAKLIKNIQVKANTEANVTANTTANVESDSKNKITNVDVESDENQDTNTTANVTSEPDENDQSKEKDENQGKAEGHVKGSAFNNRSGKTMLPLIPKVAVDHSDSLDVSGNVTLGVGKDK